MKAHRRLELYPAVKFRINLKTIFLALSLESREGVCADSAHPPSPLSADLATLEAPLSN